VLRVVAAINLLAAGLIFLAFRGTRVASFREAVAPEAE